MSKKKSSTSPRKRANGQGTIRFSPKYQKWIARASFRYQGKLKRKQRSADTYEEALASLTHLQQALVRKHSAFAADLPSGAERYVYFIRASPSGPVKIGITTDVQKRFKRIQSNSPVPLTLLHVVAGDFGLENEFHRRFAEHRLWGEWFTSTPEMIRSINALKDEI